MGTAEKQQPQEKKQTAEKQQPQGKKKTAEKQQPQEKKKTAEKQQPQKKKPSGKKVAQNKESPGPLNRKQRRAAEIAARPQQSPNGPTQSYSHQSYCNGQCGSKCNGA